jgi:hypothetical protein
MSHTAMDEKLSSLEYRYSESIDRAITRNDHAAAERLAAAYDEKARRIVALRDDSTLSPLRRLALRALSRVA